MGSVSVSRWHHDDDDDDDDGGKARRRCYDDPLVSS